MSKILELDIILNESNPKIWRRVLVPADFNFYELHYVIQFSMGWTHSHLHQFIVGKRERCIGMAYDGYFDAMEMEDGSQVNISEILNAPKDNILYEYDFGDSWEHLIEVKKVLEPEAGKKYPIVIDGAMACPLEDIGGIGGYEEFVQTMKNRDPDEPVEWLDEDFDPEAFDIAAINKEFFKNFKKVMKEWHDLAFS